jgi:hypothetical protein
VNAAGAATIDTSLAVDAIATKGIGYANSGSATLVLGALTGISDPGATGASEYILQRVPGGTSANWGHLVYTAGTDVFDINSGGATDDGIVRWYRLAT